jgi:hypothetical protein
MAKPAGFTTPSRQDRWRYTVAVRASSDACPQLCLLCGVGVKKLRIFTSGVVKPSETKKLPSSWRDVQTWCNNLFSVVNNSTCFGHLYAHLQEYWVVYVVYYCMWCSAPGVVTEVLRSRCVVLGALWVRIIYNNKLLHQVGTFSHFYIWCTDTHTSNLPSSCLIQTSPISRKSFAFWKLPRLRPFIVLMSAAFSWTDHVRNEVLLRVKEQKNILHEISKRKANWGLVTFCVETAFYNRLLKER